MERNAQDGMVVQEPKIVVTGLSLGSDAIPSERAEPRHSQLEQLQERTRAAVRSWPPGRRAWDRVVAWWAASRAAMGAKPPETPPTGD